MAFELKNIQLAAIINNFNQFKAYLKDLGQRYVENSNQIYSERINNLVRGTQKEIIGNIKEILIKLSEISFKEIEEDKISELFTEKWLKRDDFMNFIFGTLDSYFRSYKKWIMNPLYYNLLVKYCFIHIPVLYFEKLFCLAKEYLKPSLFKEYKPSKLHNFQVVRNNT